MSNMSSPRYLKATLVTAAVASGLLSAFIAAVATFSDNSDAPFDAPGASGGLLVLVALLAMVVVLAAAVLPWSASCLQAVDRLSRRAFVGLSAVLTTVASLLLMSGVAVFLTDALPEPVPTLIVLVLHLAFMLPLSLLWFAIAVPHDR